MRQPLEATGRSRANGLLTPGDHVLFIGDSITEWGRDHAVPSDLGSGYVSIAAALAGAERPELALRFTNRGVGGDTAAMVRARWVDDAVAERPDVVSLMVGVNDTWRRYDSGVATPIDVYREHLEMLVESVVTEIGARLVLIEPFLVPVVPEQWSWREDLDPRIAIVRRLAMEHGATLVAADGLFAQAAVRDGARTWTLDGVHPSPAGHALLATTWLAAVGLR